MIYLSKVKIPSSYAAWYARYHRKKWKNLKAKAKNKLRNILISEQGYICCFCGSKIGTVSKRNKILQTQVVPKEHNVRLAHIKPRSSCKCSDLDYTNICASCDAQGEKYKHCDLSQGNRQLPISPLDKNCLRNFYFNSTLGTVEPHPNLRGKQKIKAQKTIKILNLNSINLKNNRIKAMEAFDEEFGNTIERNAMNESLYSEIYRKLTTKNHEGTFNEFYFIVIANFPAPKKKKKNSTA